MTTFLIDSNILMDFFKKKDYSISLIDILSEKGHLAVSILTVTELRAGWTDQQANFYLPRFYRLINVKNITLEIAELAGKFRKDFKAKGIILPVVDTLIAATAINEKYFLVTRNKKDFPMKQIKFYEF